MHTAHPHLPANSIASIWDEQHFACLNKPHLRFSDITGPITQFTEHSNVRHQVIGHACSGTPVTRLTVGEGPLVLLAWTQMHGDEPTATAAVLDWLHILLTQPLPSLDTNWQSLVTLHIIPMLNPDGAEQRTRVNAQGIDINRDAKALQSPEGRILWEQVSLLKPDIAFNLHDQNPYYTAGNQGESATIAFLAPAFHVDKHVDAPRLRAKQLIACMADAIKHWLPRHIGRYDDTYSLRSFGDNIAATGASTILIESGAYPGDPNRQMARKMNVIALQTALEALLSNQFMAKSLADYYSIPDNVEDGLVDIKFQQLALTCFNEQFHADISVNICRKTGRASIKHIGDLSVQQAFYNPNTVGMKVLPLVGEALVAPLTLTRQDYLNKLSAGIVYFIGDQHYLNNQSGLPVLCVPEALTHHWLQPDTAAYWIMQHDNGHCVAVLNGELVSVES
ncbi:M14 family zinc carboxypeptidase [Alteromonas sp. AMM-1]|uniref:M14 family zinc carboxypeptidase n=1 Tax=Alteromonas sp. AMM-1 TaxID=3394233 RepID=UPI0039A66C2F